MSEQMSYYGVESIQRLTIENLSVLHQRYGYCYTIIIFSICVRYLSLMTNHCKYICIYISGDAAARVKCYIASGPALGHIIHSTNESPKAPLQVHANDSCYECDEFRSQVNY